MENSIELLPTELINDVLLELKAKNFNQQIIKRLIDRNTSSFIYTTGMCSLISVGLLVMVVIIITNK